MELGGEQRVEASDGFQRKKFLLFTFHRHPRNPLSCEQQREQRASDTAAINVIEHGPKLSLSDVAFYFTAGTRDLNDLGGGQPGA